MTMRYSREKLFLFKKIFVPLSFVAFIFSCKEKTAETLFHAVSADKSNIRFSNDLEPDDSLNILDYNYFYNGGGVAAADFNNDGLTDLYFTGNKVSSRLYLNKGNFSFQDITDKAWREYQKLGNGYCRWPISTTMACRICMYRMPVTKTPKEEETNCSFTKVLAKTVSLFLKMKRPFMDWLIPVTPPSLPFLILTVMVT
jgi:hypothetical protein